MSNVYRFYDSDYYGNEEYDITGGEYKSLIQLCCDYSKQVSFRYFGDRPTELYEVLENFKEKSITYVSANQSKDTFVSEEIVYYRVCPEICQILQEKVDGIFKWIYGRGHKNPEDPQFFKSDGSVFLASSIHNGTVAIFGNETEIKDVVKNPLWICEKEDKRVHGYKVLKFENTYKGKSGSDISRLAMERLQSSEKIKGFVMFCQNEEEQSFRYHCFLDFEAFIIATVNIGKEIIEIVLETIA